MQTGIKLSLLNALIVCIVQCTCTDLFMGWILTQCSIGHTSAWFPSSSDIKLRRVTNAHLVNISDWKLWRLPMGRPRVPTPSSSLNSLATAPSNDTPPKYSNLRISHWLCWKTLSWQWVWILSPNHPFAGICSSFSAVNFVRLLQLVPSGTSGCFGNVTDRVRHTLYKCYGPCTPYTV